MKLSEKTKKIWIGIIFWFIGNIMMYFFHPIVQQLFKGE